MDTAHLHLIVNHFPIIGTLIGVGVLAYGLFINNLAVKKVGLGIFVLMAILAVPAYLTGEGAEEAVEHLAGVSDHDIHEHEELAETGIVVIGALGILALFALYAFAKKKAMAKTLTIVAFLLGLVTFGLFAKVGNLGGKIRHTELSENHSSNEQNEQQSETRHDDDDDDD